MQPLYSSDSDDDVQDEPEVEVRVHHCESCEQLVVLELVDEQRHQAVKCPTCRVQLTLLQNDGAISRFTTCLVPTCENYLSTAVATDSRNRCEGNRTDKHGSCNIKTATLTLEDAEMYIYDTDTSSYEEDDPRAVRRLKARVADARAFVAGSGTHHRSKGGSHTSAAREKHSKAAKSKSFVRRYYLAALAERIAEVQRLADGRKKYAKLLEEAEKVRGQVGNK